MDGVFFDNAVPNVIQSCHTTIYDLMRFGLEQIGKHSLGPVCSEAVACEKYCKGSTLHRGGYCPSPVYDLIVGNTKRGKVITKPRTTTGITHRYLYDQANTLRWIESINNNRVSYLETIFRENDTVIGVTVGRKGGLAALSREIYKENRIVSYAILNCHNIGAGCECYHYREERYFYDSEGLCACRFIMLSPQSQFLVNKLYKFERQNGLLTAYSECLDKNTSSVINRYPITKARRA